MMLCFYVGFCWCVLDVRVFMFGFYLCFGCLVFISNMFEWRQGRLREPGKPLADYWKDPKHTRSALSSCKKRFVSHWNWYSIASNANMFYSCVVEHKSVLCAMAYGNSESSLQPLSRQTRALWTHKFVKYVVLVPRLKSTSRGAKLSNSLKYGRPTVKIFTGVVDVLDVRINCMNSNSLSSRVTIKGKISSSNALATVVYRGQSTIILFQHFEICFHIPLRGLATFQ